MFQLISKALSYVTASSYDGETRQSIGLQSGEHTNVPPARLTKTFSGTVTCFFDGRGLIDDEVYFTSDAVLGDVCPAVGCQVDVVAKRENRNDGWRASRVAIAEEDWLAESSSLEHSLAQIVRVTHPHAHTDNGLTIDLTRCQHDFNPCRGDWVSVKVDNDTSDDTPTVVSFHALRSRHFEGTITAFIGNGGTIDEDVLFTQDVCNTANSSYGTGQKVLVSAIESTQGDHSWRATSVKLVANTRDVVLHNHVNVMVNKTSSHLEKLIEPKQGISIVSTTQLGEIVNGTTADVAVVLSNESDVEFSLNAVVILTVDSQFSCVTPIGTNETNPEGVSCLLPREQVTVCFSLNARHLGACRELVVFQFGEFEIGCHLTASITDPMEDSLKPGSDYKRQKNAKKLADCLRRNGKTVVIPGQRPKRRKKIFLPKKLGTFPVPERLRKVVIDQACIESAVPELDQDLALDNYQKRMSTLLHVEEIMQDVSMAQFDLTKVVLARRNRLFVLEVPGLSESRPSLMISDRIVLSINASKSSANSCPNFEGFVHEIGFNKVGVKFNDSFHNSYNNELCDISFFCNRIPLRRAHQAVKCFKELGEMAKDLFNKSLNELQMAAVRRIVAGASRPAPYLLFGPPGTGKTVTLVESALQAWHKMPSSRLLLCAPSNSAADLLAVRLAESGLVTKADMVRLNAFMRVQPVPECIEKYSTNNLDELPRICKRRIVVCTCSTAGVLLCCGLNVGHFTHVFVDEAGQASEPECLIGVAMAAGNADARIVLAGDHCQLGAVVQSPIALRYGLSVSLLERLMLRRIYKRNSALFNDHGAYDPLLVTKLVQNYRSHPSILSLYSKLFYDGELVASGDPDLIDSCLDWRCLPPSSSDFAILFHGIRGDEMREGDCPSWFNPTEAVQTFAYVKQLLNDPQLELEEEDIGIITPYRSQVKKIRLLLNEVEFYDVKVGSVEEFQGQEKKVILLSTVRSNEQAVSKEKKHCLGFLSNPRRFNVSISRAQALLVVLGNPHVLCLDPYWCCLIQYCVSRGSFVGSDLPPLNNEAMLDSFTKALSMLGIGNSDSPASLVPDDKEASEDDRSSVEEGKVDPKSHDQHSSSGCHGESEASPNDTAAAKEPDVER